MPAEGRSPGSRGMWKRGKGMTTGESLISPGSAEKPPIHLRRDYVAFGGNVVSSTELRSVEGYSHVIPLDSRSYSAIDADCRSVSAPRSKNW